MCGIATCASYPILQGSETEEDNSFDSIFANASNFSAWKLQRVQKLIN